MDWDFINEHQYDYFESMRKGGFGQCDGCREIKSRLYLHKGRMQCQNCIF